MKKKIVFEIVHGALPRDPARSRRLLDLPRRKSQSNFAWLFRGGNFIAPPAALLRAGAFWFFPRLIFPGNAWEYEPDIRVQGMDLLVGFLRAKPLVFSS
jgi:hypothetical protein